MNGLSEALIGRSCDNIRLAQDTVQAAAALLLDYDMENATTETSVVYSHAQIQAVLQFSCAVTDERIIQRLLTVCPNTLLELIVCCGSSTRKAALSMTMKRMDSNLCCPSFSDDILSALLLGALCNEEKCAEIIQHYKCPTGLISCADLWARGDEKLLLEIIRASSHPMPLFRALTSCFKSVRYEALAKWREKGVELLEWFHSSHVSKAEDDGKPDMVFSSPLPLPPHCLSTEEIGDLISIMEHGSGVEEKVHVVKMSALLVSCSLLQCCGFLLLTPSACHDWVVIAGDRALVLGPVLHQRVWK